MTIYAVRIADHPERPHHHIQSLCNSCERPVWLDAILARHYPTADIQCETCIKGQTVSLAQCVEEALVRMKARLAAHEAGLQACHQ
jgi:hypothetical protein